jgi:undecaprenyl-diphosphatase
MSLENILALDARLTGQLRIAERPGPLRSLAAVLAHSGDSWFWLLALVMLGWQGPAFWRWRALVVGAAVLITAVMVLTIKFAVRRSRPEGDWGNIYRATDPHSFPSGHATRATMLAVMFLGLGPLWLGLVLAVWAPLVGLARVAMGVHYLSDVVVGMVLGGVLATIYLIIL